MCKSAAAAHAVKRQASAAFTYDLVTALGAVYNFGGAGFYGDERAEHLAAPIVAMAVTPDGRGYWLAGTDGSVFSFGDAHVYGSLASRALGPDQQIVTIIATADGKGYWLVNVAGAATPFGDAEPIDGGHPLPAKDSQHARRLGSHRPDGTAAWFTDSVGHVYGGGTAIWYGSRVDKQKYPITAIAMAPSGGGYWMADSNGDVWAFGATAEGALAPAGLGGTVVGMIPAQDRHGYWVASSNGSVVSGGDATSRASSGSVAGISDVVGIAAAPLEFELSKLPGRRHRIRINWPQCAGQRILERRPASRATRRCRRFGAFSIAVVGVDGWAVGDDNPCLAAEAAWAKHCRLPRRLRRRGYAAVRPLHVPQFTGSRLHHRPDRARRDVRQADGEGMAICLSYNYGYNSALDAVSYAASQGAHAKTWWLDIENDSCAPGMWNDAGAGEWWSATSASTPRRSRARSTASLAASHGRHLLHHVQWAGITNSYLPTGGTPLYPGCRRSGPPAVRQATASRSVGKHDLLHRSPSTGSPAANRSCCRRPRAAGTATRTILTSPADRPAGVQRASSWTQTRSRDTKALLPSPVQ